MRGVPRSEVICSLSYSALFFDHLPTSSSLTLVNPHWNCVCSALQTSLLSLVSGPLSGTHFPSTFLEYLLRWNFSQWCQLWDKFSIKRCLRGLILNTLANNCLFQYAFWWLCNGLVFWDLQSVWAASMPLSWAGMWFCFSVGRGSWQELRLVKVITPVRV